VARRRTTVVLPDGPALVFVGPWRPDGSRTVTPVDRTAVADPRDRALYRGLTAHADTLADKADADDATPRSPIGFAVTTTTERSGD
jgi:hypothetical protein